MTSTPQQLDQLERWMLAVVSHPEGVEAGLKGAEAHEAWPGAALRDIAHDGPHLKAVDCLRIYADMYYWRLVDVLVEEYPAVRFLLGGDFFYEIARDFLHQHPSRSPNLNRLGVGFPDFLATCDHPVLHREFLVDIARVEKASALCFDAPRRDALEEGALAEVSPEAWETLSLELTPAHQLLALEHPVDEFMEAFREERHASIPETEKSWLLIYRRDYTIWRSVLSEAQFTLLQALNQGDPLLEAIERAAALPEVDFDVLVERIGSWFQVWTGIGLICGLRLSQK